MSLFPYFAAISCIGVWSLIPVIARIGQQTIDPLQFLLLTNLFSCLSVGVFLLPNYRKIPFFLSKTNVLSTMMIGFLGCYFYYLCLYYGYAAGRSIQILIIQYLWPIFIFLFGVIFLKERLTLRAAVAIILGLVASIIALSAQNNVNPQDDFPHDLLRMAVVFVGAIAFASYSILTKIAQDISHIFAVFMYFLWATIFSLITFLAFGQWKEMDFNAWVWVMLNGIFINGLSYILWRFALGYFPATRLAPLIYATPVLSLVWIVHILDETVDIFGFIAVGLMIAAGILVMGNHTPKGKV